MTLPRRMTQLLGEVRELNEQLRRTEPLARGSLSAAVEAVEAGRTAAESVARLVPVAREVQALTGEISEQAREAEGVLRMGAGAGGGGGSRVGVESAGTLANKSGRSSGAGNGAGNGGGGGGGSNGGSERGQDGSPSVFGGLAPRPTDAPGPPQIVDGTGGASDPVFSLGSEARGSEASSTETSSVEKAVTQLGRQLDAATAQLRQAQEAATREQGRQLEGLQQQQAALARRLESPPAPLSSAPLASGLAFELRAAGGLDG